MALISAAIRRNGLRLISPHEDFTVKSERDRRSGRSLARRMYVFITLKTHQYLSVLDKVVPLLGPQHGA